MLWISHPGIALTSAAGLVTGVEASNPPFVNVVVSQYLPSDELTSSLILKSMWSPAKAPVWTVYPSKLPSKRLTPLNFV